MRIKRRTNLLLGLLFLAAAVVILLRALDILPEGIYDLLARAWPALLVIGGLSVFLRERVPLGSLIALIAGVVLVGGVAAMAFSTRSEELRDNYQESIDQAVSADITLLRVNVSTLATDVELLPSLDERTISGLFSGSTESAVQVAYTEGDDGTASLTVTETRPNEFPMLEAIGRGRLRLELPPGIGLDLALINQDGEATLNLSSLSLERLNLDLLEGDALVTLPQYKPLGSPPDATLGTLAVRDGAITIFVPTTVAARLELNRGASSLQPIYDATIYNLLADGVLEARNFDTADIQVRYVVRVPSGEIRLEAANNN